MLNQGKEIRVQYSKTKRGSITRIIKGKDWLSVNKSCQVHFSVLFLWGILWGNLDRVTKES